MARKADAKATGPGTARSRRKQRKTPTFIEQARRKQIIEVALKLFAERGFDQTSLVDIANAVGVTKGVISYHFAGKPDLGAEVIRHDLRHYGNYVQERLAKRTKGRDKLLEFIDACLDFTREHVASYVTYIDVLGCFGTLDEKRKMLAFVNERTRQMLIDMVKQGQAEGDIVTSLDPANFADILHGAVDGLQEQNAVLTSKVDLVGCKKMLKIMVKKLIEP